MSDGTSDVLYLEYSSAVGAELRSLSESKFIARRKQTQTQKLGVMNNKK
ncbi:MAG TPA: hypothetical protein VKA09_10370 [Nitrososphaeraceae archaeon]|nr:hypothetical protein [Nitrososphaeraceae archaeon]